MNYLISSFLFSVLLIFNPLSSSNSSTSDIDMPESVNTFQLLEGKTLNDLVNVNEDGTLKISDYGLNLIPEVDLEKAINSIDLANADIASGNIDAFSKNDNRLSNVANRGILCMCRDNCCISGTCCKRRILWIICLSYGDC